MTKKSNGIIPILLCGGAGSRLWPLSSVSKPKQFIVLPGMKLTLLQMTMLRLQKANFAPPIIVTQEIFQDEVLEQASNIDVKIGQLILEQISNGTAFAAILAALSVQKYYDNTQRIIIMPIDHYIEKEDDLFNAIESIKCKSHIVLFGIKPTHYESGYGYIEVSQLSHNGLSNVTRFIEKPSFADIQPQLDSKLCYWNSGIFLSTIDIFLNQARLYADDIYSSAIISLEKSDINTYQYTAQYVLLTEAKSIDKAIIEKSHALTMYFIDSKWHDIGQLHTAWEISDKDMYGNFTNGNTMLMDTEDSYVVGADKPTAVVGLKNIVVVNTDSAILIANRDSSSAVSALYHHYGNNVALTHNKASIKHEKPWGYYEFIEQKENFVLKKLYIMPNHRTSLQVHKNRAEYMIVISGNATITIEGIESIVRIGEAINIKVCDVHRIANYDTEILVILEVQTGLNISENDILRIEDDYSRV